MQSSHFITSIDLANTRREDLLRQASKRRLINAVTAEQTGTFRGLRHRLGGALIRAGEQLLTTRTRPLADELGGGAGVLHLAR